MYSFNSRAPIPQNVYKRLDLYSNTLGVLTNPETFYGPKILQNVGMYITNKQLYSYTDEICSGSVCLHKEQPGTSRSLSVLFIPLKL